MSAVIVYIADPPQYSRFGGTDGMDSQSRTWEVGDRLTSTGSATYRCTVGGVAAISNSQTMVGASVVIGATTWTLITADSWANAATRLGSSPAANTYAYVDADSSSIERFGYVTVHPGTMEPAFPNRVGGARFFTNPRQQGRFLRTSPPDALLSAPIALTPTPLSAEQYPERVGGRTDGYVTNMSGVENCVGVDIVVPATVTPTYTVNTKGDIGVNTRFLGTPVANGFPTSRTEFMSFACHSDYPVDLSGEIGSGLIYANGSYPSGIYEAVTGEYCSCTGVARGVNNALLGTGRGAHITSAVYRTSGVPAGADPVSIYIFGAYNTSAARVKETGFFMVPNTLTGARTVNFYFLASAPLAAHATNNDLFVEMVYSSAATTGQHSYATSRSPNFGLVEAAHTVLPKDTSTWEAAGLFDPTKIVISIPITISRAMPLIFRVGVSGEMISKNGEIYMCPYVGVV